MTASTATSPSSSSPIQPSAEQIDRKGLFLGLACYMLWGVFPIYFKSVGHVDSLQILLNRVVWSLVFIAIMVTVTRRWYAVLPALRNRRVLGLYTLAALVLAVNWYIYIWAVTHDHILEGSLGYFINPLVSVLFGVLVFRERMRPGQIGAVLVAAAGVAYLTWSYGHLPWIALTLALTFGFYGVLKKRAPLPADAGMAIETGVLFLPSLLGLIVFAWLGTGQLFQGDAATSGLLMLAGPITAIPLILFAGAAQRLPLYMVGMLQYLAPTLQMLVGVLIYNEPFPPYKLVGFAIIWLALLIYTVEGFVASRRLAGQPAPLSEPA